MSKTTHSAIINQELLSQLGTGDAGAFTKVYSQYYSALCVYAARILAGQIPGEEEDIVEEVFINLWKKQQSFENETHLSAFLYRAVKHTSLNHLKLSRRATERNTVFYGQQGIESEEVVYAEVTRSEVLRLLHEALSALPPQCGRIVKMGYLDGLSNQQIADALGLSLQTVKNQKLRGLALLKQRLPASKYMLLMLYFWSLFN